MVERFWACLAAASIVLCATSAAAQHARVHGTGSLARAVGGHQGDELSFGGGVFGAGELVLVPQLGAQLELGSVLLSEGDAPSDPGIEPEGGASEFHGAVGLQARPWVTADPTEISGLTGVWASTNVGVATTGGLTRMMFDVHAGYDFLMDEGRWGIGPTLGLMHVFQSNDELRPSDANIVLLGVHVMVDFAERIPPDRDGDGLIDRLDKCPDDPEDKDGFEDEDGCPELDNDEDGIKDTADNCPLDPEDKDGFQDEDGCPEDDNDKDGILDPKDKCPDEPEDKDGFEDEDGCPEPDNDQDGILDGDDLCPLEPETKNNYADHDGCPDEEQIRVVGEKIVLDDRIHFRTNSHRIRVVSHPLLERLAKLISEQPSYSHIEIQGHTDARGDAKFNQGLSERRANSVLEFLVEKGIERGRLSAVGFGSSKPLVDKRTERAWFMNRRVEFLITREVKQVHRSGGPDDASKPGGDPAGAGAGTDQNEARAESAPAEADDEPAAESPVKTDDAGGAQ